MVRDKNIEDELRKAYDAMPLEQLDENIRDIDIEPLSASSEQRIKELVKNKMSIASSDKKKKSMVRPWTGVAAAFALVLFGVAAYNADAVKAALDKMFGFVPGHGVVEMKGDDTQSEENQEINSDMPWFILDSKGVVASDDKISLEIKDAVIANGELELRYTVYLSDITDSDLARTDESLASLYTSYGYDKYFQITEGDCPLSPLSVLNINGREIESKRVYVTQTESLESVRTVCISQYYDVSQVVGADAPKGSLTIGGVSVEFSMKYLELSTTAEDATGDGIIAEIDGAKILCVPTWESDKLYVDYYAFELGEYSTIHGFKGFGNPTDTLKVNDIVICGVPDESYIFDDEGSTHIGSRMVYDLSEISGEVKNAELSATGIYVEKEYEDKCITLSDVPAVNQEINQIVEFDGISVEIAEISNQYLSEGDGYDECEHGYLVIKCKATSADDSEKFVIFDAISVNGEAVDGFYIGEADVEYMNISIPLSVPYEEITDISFDSLELFIKGDVKLTL